MKSQRLLPPTYFLVSIITMVVLRFLLPDPILFPFPFNLLGILPFAVGVYINVVADGMFRRARTTVKPFEESTTLVTTGLFRLSRNPMYLGFTLMLIGVAIGLSSLAPCVVIPIFVFLVDRLFISVEKACSWRPSGRPSRHISRRPGAGFDFDGNRIKTQTTRRWSSCEQCSRC